MKCKEKMCWFCNFVVLYGYLSSINNKILSFEVKLEIELLNVLGLKGRFNSRLSFVNKEEKKLPLTGRKCSRTGILLLICHGIPGEKAPS